MAGKLKNLRFKNIEVVVLSIEHISRILVSWELEPTSQNLKDVKFYIDRGESPSELLPLNVEGIPYNAVYEYIDSTPILLDAQKLYYYRVRAVEFQNGNPVQTFSSEPVTNDGDLDLASLYIVEESVFAHRYVHGVPTFIFKKRREGKQCPECWDPVLQRVTKSSCRTCYGTGKEGGFYPPIEAWMTIGEEAAQEQVTEWGKRQPGQTDILFTNYPRLNSGDVIFEVKSKKAWEVSVMKPAEKNRTVVLQFARLDAINPADIENRLEIPFDRQKVLVAELDERDTEREF